MRLFWGLCILFIGGIQYLSGQSVHTSDSLKIVACKEKIIQLINPQPDSALFYIKKAVKIAQTANYSIGKADADYLYAQYFRRTQKIDSAIYYFSKSVALSEKIQYSTGISRGNNGLCRNYYLIGMFDEAERACKKALEELNQSAQSDKLIIADTYLALGTVYMRKNDIPKAQRNFLLVDSIHRKEAVRPDVIAAAYQNLGGVYLDFNDLDQAESYYQKANDEFNKMPQNAAVFYLNTNNIEIGKLAYKKGEFPRSDSLLTNSYTFFKKIGDYQTLLEVNKFLSKVKVENKELGQAEALLEESFELYEQFGFKLEAATNAMDIAKIELEKKSPGSALSWANKATEISNELNNSQIDLDMAFLLSDIYSELKEYKLALEYTNQGIHLKDSLNQVQSLETLREIEGKYQTEQRDREITLLKTKNQLAEEQKTNQRNLLLGGLGFTSLAGLFLFVMYRNRQKTNKKLREVDTLKSNFFANISHEFRTPLTLISHPIQTTLEETGLSSEKRSHFEMASRNTKRLLLLVDQLLDLSKIDSGAMTLHIEKGHPTLVTAALCESFSYLANQKNIHFEVNVADKDLEGWYDRDVLEKIATNLLGNAVKYTPENGKIIVHSSVANGIFFFEIRNTGKGLSKDQKKTIFERFYQTDGYSDGAGIGLALVKELTELHQGSVSVEQEKDRWTIFTATLCLDKNKLKNSVELLNPAGRVSATAMELPADVVWDSQEAQESDLPIALIVEDNRDVQVLLTDTFKNEYAVFIASDGEEGIRMALEMVPDIIVSDVMMPIKDGIELTRTLKKDERTSHIPIVLLTAKAGDENKLVGVDVGADDYITKPFNQKILRSKMDNLVDLRKKLRSRYSQEVILKPKDIAITPMDEVFLEKVQIVLDQNLAESSFSVDGFSAAVHMSRMQLHRKLKALTGLSATEFIRSQRLKLAASMLKQSDINIAEVGYRVGFNDPAYFTKCFREAYNCTPSQFINR
jgi:signal transduction histidine kinase/DNA-binding response OmpR family regulator